MKNISSVLHRGPAAVFSVSCWQVFVGPFKDGGGQYIQSQVPNSSIRGQPAFLFLKTFVALPLMSERPPLATATVSIVKSATPLSLSSFAQMETIEQFGTALKVIFMEGRKTMGCQGGSSHGNKWTNPEAINSVVIPLSSIKGSERGLFRNQASGEGTKEMTLSTPVEILEMVELYSEIKTLLFLSWMEVCIQDVCIFQLMKVVWPGVFKGGQWRGRTVMGLINPSLQKKRNIQKWTTKA